MKRIIRIAAVFLCLMLLTGCTGLLNILQDKTDLRSKGLTTFSELEYVRPDMDAIKAQFDKTAAMHNDGSSMQKLLSELYTCWELYLDFYTMDVVAEIRSYSDMTDTYYAEEASFCLDAEAQVEQLFEQLQIAGANCEKKEQLEQEFWGEGILDAYVGSQTGTYDDTYVSLAQEEGALLTKYRAANADATVTFRGKETSYSALCNDTSLTQAELQEINEQYYDKYSAVLGEIYIDLVDVRQRIAAYTGYDSYEAFAYDWLYVRDYSPEQADALLEDIRTWLAPVYRQVNEAGLWDTVRYDPMTEEEIYQTVGAAAQALGGEIAESFDYLDRHELYDIHISERKTDISYQTYLPRYDVPFILVKTYGYNDDSLCMAHEFGHFVDAYVNYNATDSLELAEVFSHSMEYLMLCTLPQEQAAGLSTVKLLDTLDTYAQQASYAAFEKTVYEIPAEELTVETLNEISLQNARDYGYLAEGMEDYYAKSWIDIPHFFEYPFYVVSYCVAGDTAFQIYQLEQASSGAGLEQFNLLLPRDHEGLLDTLKEQSTLESPFAPDRMKKTAETFCDLLSLQLP